MWVKYWDESSTCAVLEFKVEEPIATAPTQKEKREKKKKGKHHHLKEKVSAKPHCSGGGFTD
jgi:hypothetical protein